MYSYITTATNIGLESHLIKVEVDVSPGLPCFQMVGSLSSEAKESKERVRVALKNAGMALPPMSINVNLSPANIRKEGTSYDLPLAIAILIALEKINSIEPNDILIIGELGLDGKIKPIRGVLPIVTHAVTNKITNILLPKENAAEAALVPGINIYGVSSLSEAVDFINAFSIHEQPSIKDSLLPFLQTPTAPETLLRQLPPNISDFSDVKGQDSAKRAAIVCAAGFHNMLMVGPPGSGKSMIAKRLPGILPPLTYSEALEVTSIYSIAGMLQENNPIVNTRPFLAPHHTITEQALAGGGQIPRPGIISLAHKGVLFLDEMTEYNRQTLDIMRQPLEDKYVHISRSHGVYKYPADFLLVAACNPCPCGYYPDLNKCHCYDSQVKKYLSRISGPLLDRIDICCNVDPIEYKDLNQPQDSNSLTSAQMREQVMIARAMQEYRFAGTGINFNALMSDKDIGIYCKLGHFEKLLLENAFESFHFSTRSYHRILKCARTIADLSESENINELHLSEAILYRTNGSRYWGL